MEHSSTPIDLLDATPSIGAARITIFAVRSRVSDEIALRPGLITLMPDEAVLSESQAAVILAAMPAPVRYGVPAVRDGMLAVRCEPITESPERDHHLIRYAMRRPHMLGYRRLFRRRQDLSAAALARLKILLASHREQLLVTGEAFDCWMASYNGPHAFSGGPAREWRHRVELGRAVQKSRPDHVFRFGPGGIRATISTIEDLAADTGSGTSPVECSRCGRLASKILRKSGAEGKATELLCARCAEKAFPRPRKPPKWPRNPAQLTPEDLLRLFSHRQPEHLAQGREFIKRWLTWADNAVPMGATAPLDVVAIRAIIKQYQGVIGLE